MDILRFLARRASRMEMPPGVREIGEAVGLSSSRSAHAHLSKLEEAGYLERPETGRGRARPPRLTENGWRAVLSEEASLLGRVAAGRGLEAIAETDSVNEPAAQFLFSSAGRRRYLLRVVGQSMTGARIEDGDVLVVEEDEAPPDGAVVVALLRGGEEVTVKKLYREGAKVRLVPQNGAHEDLVVNAEDVLVQGRVMYVVHPPDLGRP
jgi:repressor LexA